MKFYNASDFVKSANAGLTPVNGMYLLYTNSRTTEIPALTGSGAVLQAVKSAVQESAADMGLCRMPAVLTSGGTVLSSGGAYTYYGNTGACDNVCGVPYAAGVYARAVMLVNLDRGSNQANGYMYDTGLNYDELTTPVVAPANGAITIIEKVTI